MNIDEALRSIALPMLRFGYYTSSALVLGAVPVLLLVVRPAFAGLQGDRWATSRRRVASRLEGLIRAALVAAAATTAMALVMQAVVVAEFRDGDISMRAFGSVFDSSFGRWYGLRFPLLAALGVILVNKVSTGALAGAGDERRSPGALWWMAWLALAAALLATSSLAGHAATANPRALAMTNDIVHLTAGAIWLTGVIILAVVMPEGWARRGPPGVDLMVPVVVRFSRLAPIAISVVAATGILNAFLHLEAVGDITGTSYGRALGTKLLLFATILLLGAVNHWVVARRMRRAQADRSEAARVFKRTIAAEVAVGLLIIGATGVLAGLPMTKEDAGAQRGVGVSARR